MDWKYKHFDHQAIFNAPRQSVLEAARTVMAESLGGIEDTTDGFVARGRSAWHAAVATFRITPTANGTLVAVELLVERSTMRGYMLVDIGGYYEGQIDKWFTRIAERLASAPEQVVVSKTTTNVKTRRGCFAGCLVYLVVGVCLGALVVPLEPTPGPLAIAASLVGLIAGLAVFLYVMNPDEATFKSIRKLLPSKRNDEGH
jgi:hypothetical protein